MKKIYLIIAALFFISAVIFYFEDDTYSIKISLKCNNCNAFEIDSNIAEEIKDKLFQTDKISKIFIFSKHGLCNIYCKIRPFQNKKEASYTIQNKLNLALNNIDKEISISYEDDYDSIYQAFIVIYSDSANYKVLKKYLDITYDKIIDKKISSKILSLEDCPRCVYLNYLNSSLVKFDLSLLDIINIINSNNINKNSTIYTNKELSYPIITNGNFKNIEDIKNTSINYKDKNFSIKFKDVFEIKEDVKAPADYITYFNNKNALVLAISKRKNMPLWFFKFKLSSLINNLDYPKYINLKIINTDSINIINAYLNESSSIEQTCKMSKILYEKINKNLLVLSGIDCPKTSNNSIFLETLKNKITIVSNKKDSRKIKNILDNLNINYETKRDLVVELESESLDDLYKEIEKYKKRYKNLTTKTTNKELSIKYDIDSSSLSDYLISKQEVINALIAKNDGLEAAYFYNNGVKIPIVIENKDNFDDIYIYSKNFKTLLSLKSFAKSSLENEFSTITRKNGKYYSRLRIKKH